MVRFSGVVHPQAGGWYLDGPVTLHRFDARIDIHLHASRFSMELEIAGDDDIFAGDVSLWGNEVWYDAEATLRAVLDSLGFARGASLDIELVSGSVDDRGLIFPMMSMAEFAAVDGDHVESGDFGRYAGSALDNVHVRHALADMRMALSFSDDAAFYCYRAIESLRQHFVDGREDDDVVRRESWPRLRAALGVGEDELRLLAAHAKSRRHGGARALSHRERLEVVKRTRVLVDQFIRTLPAIEFPPRVDV
ncbi:hypothetical protein [Rhodococcus koreensis]